MTYKIVADRLVYLMALVLLLSANVSATASPPGSPTEPTSRLHRVYPSPDGRFVAVMQARRTGPGADFEVTVEVVDDQSKSSVFAATIPCFGVDVEHVLWRGDSSAFLFRFNQNETGFPPELELSHYPLRTYIGIVYFTYAWDCQPTLICYQFPYTAMVWSIFSLSDQPAILLNEPDVSGETQFAHLTRVLTLSWGGKIMAVKDLTELRVALTRHLGEQAWDMLIVKMEPLGDTLEVLGLKVTRKDGSVYAITGSGERTTIVELPAVEPCTELIEP